MGLALPHSLFKIEYVGSQKQYTEIPDKLLLIMKTTHRTTSIMMWLKRRH